MVVVETCIWHLMSSIGVRRREVKAPLAAPQVTRAGSGSGGATGSLCVVKNVAWRASWARR